MYQHLPKKLVLDAKPMCLRGSSSILHQGMYGNQRIVAKIKYPKTTATTATNKLHQSIPDHPNILPLLASTTSHVDGSTVQVYPFMKNGSIESSLHILKKEHSFHNRVHLLHEITHGLIHLENHGIAHRDIKASNILLNNEGVPLLSDFEEAIYYQENTEATINIRGSPYHMPPEILKEQLLHDNKGYTQTNMYGVPTEMYSFGVLCYEVIEMKTPYLGVVGGLPGTITRHELFQQIIHDHYRPQLNSSSNDNYNNNYNKEKEVEIEMKKVINDLMECCWSDDPLMRPSSFTKVSTELNNVLTEMKASAATILTNDGRNRLNRPLADNDTDNFINMNNIVVGSSCNIGGRNIMEDVIFYQNEFNVQSALCAVFDGHNGDYVAKQAANLLQSLKPTCTVNNKFILKDVYNMLNRHLIVDDHAKKCGSTATIGYIETMPLKEKNAILVNISFGWLGDSRGIFIETTFDDPRQGGKSDDMKKMPKKSRIVLETVNHTPCRKDEKIRIENCGGSVKRLQKMRDDGLMMPYGPYRVFTNAFGDGDGDGDNNGGGDIGLAVSRALGDTNWHPYVSSNYEETAVVLKRNQEKKKKSWLTMIVATDGIWDVLTDDDLFDIIHDEKKMARNHSNHSKHLADQIVKLSLKKRTPDNCAVVVAQIV
jgi:serine/threonine protein kinase